MAGKKQIANPGGLWGLTADNDTQVPAEVVNNSGGTLLPGDVVVASGVDGTQVTTTTTANSRTAVGVVLPQEGGNRTVGATETVAAGAVCQVCLYGVARINIGGNTVAVGDILATSTTAKVAVVNNAATVGQAIAIALEASGARDANNTIRALIAKM